jgi:hypothetical protein
LKYQSGELIPNKEYDDEAKEFVANELVQYTQDKLSYVQECLVILQEHIRKRLLQKQDLIAPLRAIHQKAHNLDSDQATEKYYTLIPALLKK